MLKSKKMYKFKQTKQFKHGRAGARAQLLKYKSVFALRLITRRAYFVVSFGN